MGKEQEPYLHDVQVGDKLYNFLEDNEEYVVVHISEEYEEITIRLSDLPQGVKDPRGFEITINPDGTMERGFTVPHFLYAPVDVLDPKNLPLLRHIISALVKGTYGDKTRACIPAGGGVWRILSRPLRPCGG